MTTEEILEVTAQLTDEQRNKLIQLLQKQQTRQTPRQPGILAGHLIIAEDFDAPYSYDKFRFQQLSNMLSEQFTDFTEEGVMALVNEAIQAERISQ